MPKQKKDIKFKCVSDSLGRWGATLRFTNGEKTITYSVYAATGVKNRAAKSFIKETFDENLPDFLERHPGFSLIEEN